jgi:hypothetical protein
MLFVFEDRLLLDVNAIKLNTRVRRTTKHEN